ncbi:hypothetical protein [Shinella kummerowiae]|uniref:hypothetical protein n=1 Tax=Shinella kummerowiae TaxID=417745 RepID=UPI0021B62E97|nr:hypothetical protein [Shinella kummerowiae]MCT7665665.1 hypothetical protein [Shinella kummerowiae]
MVRWSGRAARRRIRRGLNPKLRTAFRWRLTNGGRSDWLQRLADENPEEAAFIEIPEREEGAEAEDWFALYFRAWENLRHDRFYGAFGGETPISYLAISRYAADHDIAGDDFRWFLHFVQACDAEWLDYRSEQEKRKP